MASNYTGNPTSVQPPSAAPGPGVAPIISIPSGTDPPTIDSITQEMKCLADFSAYATSIGGGSPFGDGSDGNVTISLSTNLTRDMYYNNLTLTGGNIIANGFRIFVRNTLTTGGFPIKALANPGSGTTGGTGSPSGSLAGGAAGGAGHITAGAAGSATVSAIGGAGGKGGDALNTGGAGGTATAPVASLGGYHSFSPSSAGHICGLSGGTTLWTALQGGGGGGGGAGDGTSNSGMGGGGGGGLLVVCARRVVLLNASDLIAAGGAGADGTSTPGTEGGGGGGGGGGALILAYGTLSVGSGTVNAATNCPGGAGGAGGSNGLAGAAGSNGSVIQIQLS